MTPHEVAIPKLHASLWETRRELADVRDLARRLAEQLDAHVDEAHGGPKANVILTGKALYDARQMGLIE